MKKTELEKQEGKYWSLKSESNAFTDSKLSIDWDIDRSREPLVLEIAQY